MELGASPGTIIIRAEFVGTVTPRYDRIQCDSTSSLRCEQFKTVLKGSEKFFEFTQQRLRSEVMEKNSEAMKAVKKELAGVVYLPKVDLKLTLQNLSNSTSY